MRYVLEWPKNSNWLALEFPAYSIVKVGCLGGRRAFRTTPQVPKGWPSCFAGAPNLASAASGPGFGPFAG